VGMTYFLLSNVAYFSHGQQNVFTSIDWVASTAGGGDMMMDLLGLGGRMWWKGLLVGMRTFGSSLLPLLLWTGRRRGAGLGRSHLDAAIRCGYVLFWVGKALASAIAALILRDHLMAVAIFGPNLVFNVLHASCVVVAGAITAML
jgi:hypothetical protein